MCILNSTTVIGLNDKELTILQELFLSEPTVKKWKIDFTVYTSSFYGGTATGRSSIIVGINELPINGSCTISPTTGIAASTIFTITCTKWVDPDGNIVRYEYWGNSFPLQNSLFTVNELIFSFKKK
jgi:REJ domain